MEILLDSSIKKHELLFLSFLNLPLHPSDRTEAPSSSVDATHSVSYQQNQPSAATFWGADRNLADDVEAMPRGADIKSSTRGNERGIRKNPKVVGGNKKNIKGGCLPSKKATFLVLFLTFAATGNRLSCVLRGLPAVSKELTFLLDCLSKTAELKLYTK